MAKKTFPVYRAKKSFSADMEFGMVKFIAGKTYTDDGSTIFDVYACEPDFFEPAKREPDTIVLTHPNA